ncbi:lysine N(6)-hydroxylase/L-ornithine N(5)-oxygenase family protein [Aeromicrobium sp. CTD01-1L150]|uniref:lysine N(6)-hydroxylase/L-ornithine N(5)-oxygenase family protein n=1 Tax=Aeromicrobium sp. CTD01-1L150 TaxID=3341830 RepID=UPI0035BF4767
MSESPSGGAARTRGGTVHDFIAIGAGPFNLGLACLADTVDGLDGLVLEARDEIAWHPGMMLPDATLQVPFLADLVTMADPTSPYSFLNWLKQTQRLYPFYIRESFYPLRAEYDAYCRWAAERLGTVMLGRHVESVAVVTGDDGRDHYVVEALTPDGTETHRARHLVLGTGTSPHVPDAARNLFEHEVAGHGAVQEPGPRRGPALHSADYLDHKRALQATGSITIVGSGQSAAEIYRDLLEDVDTLGYRLTWVTRSPRFFPMEYTKLTLEMTSPEYTRYFQSLPAETRDRLIGEHKPLYKGISSEVVDDIFDTLYRKSVAGPVTTDLLTGTALAAVERRQNDYALELRHVETGVPFRTSTESLVLATGYRAVVPGFVEPLRDRINTDDRGRYAVSPTYTIDDAQTIHVQNAEEHTHGFVAPDLGMGAYRSSVIINQIAGREVYPVEERIAFQTFGPLTAGAGSATPQQASVGAGECP